MVILLRWIWAKVDYTLIKTGPIFGEQANLQLLSDQLANYGTKIADFKQFPAPPGNRLTASPNQIS
jgi:hypothetical protein